METRASSVQTHFLGARTGAKSDLPLRCGFRVGVSCLISVGLIGIASLVVPGEAAAGLSGPGGPRLNYEYMPRIEDYKPLREGVENGDHTAPSVPYVKQPAPEHRSAPAQTGASPKPQQPEQRRREQRSVEGPGATTPNSPPNQVAPNLKASPKPRSRAATPGPGSVPPNAKTNKTLPKNARAQRKQILTRLYGYLSDAKDKSQAARLAQSIEELWLHSGSPTTDLLMKRTDRAIETGRWHVAETFSDAIVKLQPGYTEGWMRRALIHYQRRKPTRALRSLRRVLAIEPNHFLALDRVGAILESVGEYKPALQAYRKLKRLHPQAPGVKKRIEELIRKVEGEQI